MNEKRLFKRYVNAAIRKLKDAEKLLPALGMDADTFDDIFETLNSLTKET